MDKALSNLEKVTVWLVGHKVDCKVLLAVCRDLNLSGCDVEWVSDLLACSLVDNLQQCPVDAHWEHKFVVESQRFLLALPSGMGESEVNVVNTKLELPLAACAALEHFLVQNNL